MDYKIISHIIKKSDGFPNNEKLPLLIYKGALRDKTADEIEDILEKNGWKKGWRNGIYDFHHYHSNTHEVLVVYSGRAKVQFGGPKGPFLDIEKGDVVIIPVGVSHKSLELSKDFSCIGMYPTDTQWDMNYGNPNKDKPIKEVGLPKTDPLYGKEGPLFDYWLFLG